MEHEQFVKAVTKCITERKWKELREYLKENAGAGRIANKCDAALSALTKDKPIMADMILLNHKMSVSQTPEPVTLVNQLEKIVEKTKQEKDHTFMDNYIPLFHNLTKILVKQKQARSGIALLRFALKKLQSSEAELTSIHADFLELCLSAQCFRPALPILNTNIRAINSEAETFDSKSFLLYYYYGALIYIALKNYERGLLFLQVVLTTPAQAVSNIMLEAFKKYQLVSLLIDGKVPSLPKYTSNVVTRQIKSLCHSYTDVAEAYKRHDAEYLGNVITRHQHTFTRDKNYGLVKQVYHSLAKQRILQLTKTFLAVTLADLASRVSLRTAYEAELVLLEMIDDGMIHCSIDETEGVVNFQNNPNAFTTSSVLEKIEKQMETCMRLKEELHDHEVALSTSSVYLQKVVNATSPPAPVVDDASREIDAMYG